MPVTNPLVSPLVFTAADYQGNQISVSVAFGATALHALASITVSKDAGCVYVNVYFGLGPDGTPNTTPTQYQAPDGVSTIPAGTLTGWGFSALSAVVAGQVTFGP